jgi:dipeptidyl aminopeptidase/acylaminoacyl peptidase
MKYRYVLLIVLLFLQACAVAPQHPSLVGQSQGKLISVRDFVADMDFTAYYQLSPDGKQLGWIGISRFKPAVFLKNLDDGKTKIIPKLGEFTWTADSQYLLVTADEGGDENHHVYKIPARGDSAAITDLTPWKGAKSQVHTVVRDTSDILITSNRRNPKVFDLYQVDTATGKTQLVGDNPGKVNYWLVNKHGKLLARVHQQGERLRLERAPAAPGGEWVKLFGWSMFDTIAPLDISDDDQSVWALSNRGRDKAALVKISLQDGHETVVYADPAVDVEEAFISKKTRQPIAAVSSPDFQKIKVFDPVLAQEVENILRGKRARLTLTGADDAENQLIYHLQTEQGGQHVLYNRTTRQSTVLSEDTLARITRKNAGQALARTEPVSFQSRDGLTLHGYLTLPTGVKAQNLPMVLSVHGGPWARDRWFAEKAFFLANRGYAVLQVNYRGSGGYGRRFQEAAIGEFAGKMHDDLIDGVQWAIGQGIADPKRVAISGGSYGGYATLVGLTFTPEVFACGVDFVGISDLASLLESTPEYWELSMPWWHKYVGDPKNPAQRNILDAKSPLYKVEQVTKPLLIMHGVNDPRVKLNQSERMVAALQKLGKPVRYVTFAGDGHGNDKWSNNLTLYREMEDFFAACLGGRSSGFDVYQLGSWAF